MKRALLLLSLTTLLLAALAATATATVPEGDAGGTPPAQAVDAPPTCNSLVGENLLANPSFEPPYEPPPPGYHPDCIWGPCQSAKTAWSWSPWWQSSSDSSDPYLVMPEWKGADPDVDDPIRVLTGEAAQQYFTTFATFKAGVFQQVAVEAGEEYVFSVWGHTWTQDKNDFDHLSGPVYGNLYQMIGIHPAGSADWTPWTTAAIGRDNGGGPMVWSEMRLQYDVYDTFEVTATAQADAITVVLWARPEWAVKDNNVYWEDACLIRRKMEVQGYGLGLLADVDEPEQRAFTVPIYLSGAEGWTATLSPTGTLTPTLHAATGQGSGDLEVIIDSTNYPTGIYTTALTITADPAVPGSPVTIPLTLHVVEERVSVLLPSVQSGSAP